MVGHNKLVDFNHDGSKFAHSGPDGALRLWDVTSGLFQHEFRPAEHLSAATTCIKFSPHQSKPKSKKRKKRDSLSDSGQTNLIGLGTVAGTVLVYDHESHELLCSLVHAQTSSVTDVAWDSHLSLFSLGEDGNLIQWDVLKKKPIRTLSVLGKCSLCLIDDSRVVVGSHSLHMTNLENQTAKAQRKFTGHSSPVTEIINLPSPDETDNSSYFLSAAEDDKFVSVWCCQKSGSDPVCSLMIKDLVYSMNARRLNDGNIKVAVSSHKGAVRIFCHHLNGKKPKPITSSCLLKVTTGGLGKKNTAIIPILASRFVNDGSIVIVYSTSVALKFEQISLDSLNGEIYLTRSPSDSIISKENDLLKTVTPAVSKDTTHLRPGHMNTTQTSIAKRKVGDEDGTTSLPMEERLNALALDQRTSQTTAPPRSDNHCQLLRQGLRSKDKKLLSTVLCLGDDEQLVNNTVRRLPLQDVVPFIQHLQTLASSKGHRNFSYVTWLKAIFYHHMSYLSTLQDRQSLMKPFYAESSAMLCSLPKFTQLHARLDLILTQVTNRHQEASKVIDSEALLIYKDESSEEEDDGEMNFEFGGGASESEDNWDDLSDVNGQSDDDQSDMDIEGMNHKNDDEELLTMDADDDDDGIPIISDDGDDDSTSDDDTGDSRPKENGLIICTDEEDTSDDDDV